MTERRHSSDTEPHAPLWRRFDEFINPASNRAKVLNELLIELNFHYSAVQFGKSRHFFISSEGREAPPRVLVAHYDSVTGSPGANDNASSVFILLSAAQILRDSAAFPWMIIFTDNEELTGDMGIRSQGSYLLGRALKNTALAGADFFVFDSCGHGETLVISTMADYIMKNKTGGAVAQVQKRLHDLRAAAMNAAGRSALSNYVLLPTPFSDDAGFLQAGLAAQMLTMLPAAEAAAFAQLSRANPRYIHALISRELQQSIDMNTLPETWRHLNSSEDTAERLTREHFSSIIKFALALFQTGR